MAGKEKQMITEQEMLRLTTKNVQGLAYKLTGNSSDAEDLAQEALIRAVGSLAGFKGESKVETWVHRITVNTWNNMVRDNKTKVTWDTEPISSQTQWNEKSTESIVESNELTSTVREAVNNLDKDDKEIIILRDFEYKSYKEMAVILSIPIGTVQSRLSRARKELGNILAPFGV